MVENTTDVLKNEAARVSLFLGQGSGSHFGEAGEFPGPFSREETVFSLFNRIIDDNLEGALEVLRKILLSSSPGQGIGLLGGLQFQVRRVLDFKTRLHRHPDPGFSVQRNAGLWEKESERSAEGRQGLDRRAVPGNPLPDRGVRDPHALLSGRVSKNALWSLFLIQTMANHGRIVPKPVWFYPGGQSAFSP
jgi:hypothetical protein